MPNAQTFSPGPGILLQPTRPAALYKVQRRSAASSDVFLRQVHLLPLAGAPDYKESSPTSFIGYNKGESTCRLGAGSGEIFRPTFSKTRLQSTVVWKWKKQRGRGKFLAVKSQRANSDPPHKSSCVTFRQVCARSLATMYYYTYTRRDFSWMQLRGCSSAQVQAIFGKDSACLKYKMGDGACGEKAKLAKMTR